MAFQENEGMEKIRYRDLSETVSIKSEVQTTKYMIRRIYQDWKDAIESIYKELDIIRMVMPSIFINGHWSEDMDS